MNQQKAIKKYVPMTETMFYILLSLREESYGYAIHQSVETLTRGRLNIGAGTMYQSLGKLSHDGLIRMTQEKDRQKRYIITEVGMAVLQEEAARIRELCRNVEVLK